MWNLQQGFGAGGFGGRVAYRCFIFSEKTMGKGTSKCLWLLSTCDGVWVVILMPEKMIQFEFICFKWVGKHLPATVAMVNRKVRNLPPQAWDDDLFWDDEVHLQNLQIKLEFQQFGTTLRKKKQYAAPASAKIDELKTINWTRIILNLVGGWNPFEKYARQNGLIFRVKIPINLWNHLLLMVQKSHSQPPGMVLKPRKLWDELPTRQPRNAWETGTLYPPPPVGAACDHLFQDMRLPIQSDETHPGEAAKQNSTERGCQHVIHLRDGWVDGVDGRLTP